MSPHLPYDAEEAAYRADGVGRYRSIRDDLGDVIGTSDREVDRAEAAAVAAAVATWLESRQRAATLYGAPGIPNAASEYVWFDRHIAGSYTQGQRFGAEVLDARGLSVSSRGLGSTTHQKSMRKAFDRQRHHWDRLGRDLRTATSAAVREAIDEGSTYAQASAVARDRVQKVGMHRARYIAEYEPAWAFNRAVLAEYEDAGIEGVTVDATVVTAGDERVCETCASQEGRRFSVTQVSGMMEKQPAEFPFHVLCRCLLMPEARRS